MANVRVRRLWINIRWDDKSIPEHVSREEILETLIRSIELGDYRIPQYWRVMIEWRNKSNVSMRRGEWTAEMSASAESSSGFDKAVLAYLENRLRSLRQ